jgi:hypothetical protein
MPPRTSWTQREFAQAAKSAVPARKDVIMRRLGGDPNWEVKAGHTYELIEMVQVTLKLCDAAGEPHDFKVAGTIDLGELSDLVRTRLGLPKW